MAKHRTQGPAVIVFIQKMCGACHEFMPRFQRIAEPYKQCGVALYAPDVGNEKDKKAQAAAEFYKIEATPTMVVISARGRVKKIEGAVEDEEIVKALGGFACDVPGT
jgi:thiol-disulfide isomerase/thioredoxin